VALPALLAAVVMTAAEHLAGTAPIRSALKPTGIVWSNRVFATRGEFSRWLRARGVSYETWASNHPAAEAAAARGQSPVNPAASIAEAASPDHNHLLAIAVAGFVAAVLVLVLLYQRKTYDFRGRLQRSAPRLATAVGRVRVDGAVVAVEPRLRPPALPLRQRALRAASATARTIATGAGPAAVSLANSAVRWQDWVRRVRDEHPELTWYLAACAFATTVGVVVPFVFR
jgi:hypothetical protein